MLISERAAAEILTRRIGISREQARLLLHTGVAGEAERVGRSAAYDERRVQDVAMRPFADESALAETCPWGVYVTRVARDRSVDVSRPWSEQAARLGTQRPLPPMTAATLGVRVRVSGGLPWVATVSGFVVFGGEATSIRPDERAEESGAAAFDLRPPGDWFAAIDRRWFAFGRGRHWFLWDPWRLQQ